MPMHKFTPEDLDIFDKARPRDKVAMAIQFTEHAAAEKECHAFGEAVARECGCQFIKGPMKTLTRSDQKVVSDYEGDWSKVKDLVRMTILAPDPSSLAEVGRAIRRKATAPWGVLKDEEVLAEKDVCGYSGLNFVLQKNRKGSVGMVKAGQAAVAPRPDAMGISNAEWAKTVRMEIQANVPEIIYGKECADDFVKMLGEYGADLLPKMKAKSKIVGGLGHVFYEISKGAVPAVVQFQAKALSKRYYAYLRNPSSLSHSGFNELCFDLSALIDRTKSFFAKHPVASVSIFGRLVIPSVFGK